MQESVAGLLLIKAKLNLNEIRGQEKSRTKAKKNDVLFLDLIKLSSGFSLLWGFSYLQSLEILFRAALLILWKNDSLSLQNPLVL